MALFQPTNIIPSSFTDGVIDVNDVMQISWQVNGNTAMTAFQIDFYQNDATSTPIESSGIVNQGINTSGFFGTNRFGQPQMFTWDAGKTWSDFSADFTNGNQYKYKITQMFRTADDVYSLTTTSRLQNKMKLALVSEDGATVGYAIYDFGNSTYGLGGTVYYNLQQHKGWFVLQNKILVIPVTFSAEDPSEAAKIGDGTLVAAQSRYDFVLQTSFNAFVALSTPTIEVYGSDSDYTVENTFPDAQGNFNSSIGYFKAEYAQAQSVPIRWVQWQVATAENTSDEWTVTEVISDTGEVNTPTLQFEFNGFFNGNGYAIRCMGESEQGQPFDSGWKFFTIKIDDTGEYTGNFVVQCLPKENAALLEWESVEVISPTVMPQEYSPVISQGSVTLPAKGERGEYSIAWNTQNEAPINFPANWTAVWKGKTYAISLLNNLTKGSSGLNSEVSCAAFSPDGKFLIVGGAFSGYAAVYSVNGTTVKYVADITKTSSLPGAPSTPLDGAVFAIAFDPKRSSFVLGGAFSGYAARFSYSYDVSGNPVITFVANITKGGTAFTGVVNTIAYDSTGIMILGGRFSGYAALFDSTYAYKSDIVKGDAALTSSISKVSFLPNSRRFVLCDGKTASVFSYLATTTTSIRVTYVSDIMQDGVAVGATDAIFNPAGTLVVFRTSSNTLLFTVKNNEFAYAADVTKIDAISITSGAFSPDGNLFVCGDEKTVSVFSVDSTDAYSQLVFVADIRNSTARSDSTATLAFNPTGTLIVSGGSTYIQRLVGYAAVYKSNIYPQGKLMTLQCGNTALELSKSGQKLSFSYSDGSPAKIELPITAQRVAVVITPTEIYAYVYGASNVPTRLSQPLTYTQQAITSVTVYGGDSGATIDAVSVFQGDGANVLQYYASSADFEPVWNASTYSLYMTANFNGSLEGGTGTASGVGFRVYRQEIGGNVLTPVATLSSTQTSLKDFGIRSRRAYKYLLYVYDTNGAFIQSAENDSVVATNFKNFSLMVCDYDSATGAYHVRKQYLFAGNLSEGSVSNNNAPTLSANFTAYPTRMPSTQNYASGTLQGLIGVIYTVPALIEQIGGMKHTVKPSTLDYFDSVDLEKELYDLSIAPYQLFLRDMKGHLRMISTNGAISMTTNLKQRQQSVSISFPWVEIGDASDAVIIQTPDDYGWNNDNQVLDARLDVDPTTGVLSARYPKPYEGTRFYLVGANREVLEAETPVGVTPAQFDLSESASKTTDGILTATTRAEVK